MADLPERPNEAGFAAFSERSRESSPVTMLNLLEFLPDGRTMMRVEQADDWKIEHENSLLWTIEPFASR